MRVLCDQMVRERYVETLESDPAHTVARIRDALQPDASDDAVASYATAEEWAVLTADDDFFDEEVPHGLLYYEDHDPPSARTLREAVRAIDTAYETTAAVTEWIPDGWV